MDDLEDPSLGRGFAILPCFEHTHGSAFQLLLELLDSMESMHRSYQLALLYASEPRALQVSIDHHS